METHTDLKVLLEQLNFMQKLHPTAVEMDYKRTGSFEMKVWFSTVYLKNSVKVRYEFTYNQKRKLVQVVLYSTAKIMFKCVAKTFEEIVPQLHSIIKPKPSFNPHMSKMSFEAHWLIWNYIKNRPNAGFTYKSKFETHQHDVKDKNSQNGFVHYSFERHGFPLVLDSYTGNKRFTNEQAFYKYLSAK